MVRVTTKPFSVSDARPASMGFPAKDMALLPMASNAEEIAKTKSKENLLTKTHSLKAVTEYVSNKEHFKMQQPNQ